MHAANSAIADATGGADSVGDETEVTASYVQQRAGDLIDRALAGERFKVTRHGTAKIAVLFWDDYVAMRDAAKKDR